MGVDEFEFAGNQRILGQRNRNKLNRSRRVLRAGLASNASYPGAMHSPSRPWKPNPLAFPTASAVACV